MASIGLDASEFSKGIKGVETQTQGLEKAFDSLKGFIGKAFSVAAIASFVSKFKQTADEIIRATQEVNASAEGYQALRNSMRDAGQSADGLNSYLAKLYTASIDAQNGNQKLVGAFNNLGISVADLRTMRTDELFGAIAEAVANTADETDSYGAVLDIFGSRMTAKVLPALKSVGTEGFDQLTKRMQESGRVIDTEFLVKLNKLETAWDTITQKIYTFGVSLFDAFDMVMKGLVGAAQSGKSFSEVMELLANERLDELKAAREQAEATRQQQQAMADAAAEAQHLADEVAALEKAEKDLADAYAEVDKSQYDSMTAKQKLEEQEKRLEKATQDLIKAQAEEAANHNPATVEALARATREYNSVFDAKIKAQQDYDKELAKNTKAEEDRAKAVDNARKKYEDLKTAQDLAKKSTKEQAEWHQKNAERLREEADASDDAVEKFGKLEEALREEAKAEGLFTKAAEEAADAQDKANESIVAGAEAVQKLADGLKGISKDEFEKLKNALGDLADIAANADFSSFRDLDYITRFRLPSNLTKSRIMAFVRNLQYLADSTKGIKIDLPDGLAELGKLLEAAGGKTEITIKAPPKEDLTLQIPKPFESDIASLAKSAATLAKLKGVIYA